MVKDDDLPQTEPDTNRTTKVEGEGTGLQSSENLTATDETYEDKDEDASSADALEHHRTVYAAYFAGSMGVAFLCDRFLNAAWAKLAQLRPEIGEPKDEVCMTIAAVIGVGVGVHYWRSEKVRGLAEDVANELAKVTWPTKKEVANNTLVVVVTTLFATVFFTLMDRFWSFVTNWVYGT